MSTHVNAFKDEVKEAFGKVQGAVNDAQAKLDALIAKLDENQAEVADPAATIDAEPVAPAKAEDRDSKGHFASKK